MTKGMILMRNLKGLLCDNCIARKIGIFHEDIYVGADELVGYFNDGGAKIDYLNHESYYKAESWSEHPDWVVEVAKDFAKK